MANLNYGEIRKKKLKRFFIAMGIVFVFVLYAALQVASYRNSANDGAGEDNPIIGTFHIVDAIKEHPIWFPNLSGPYTWKTLGLFGGIYLLAFGYFFYDMERRKTDPLSTIAGSAEWNNDYKGFAKQYSEPNSLKNLILSQNVSLSMNTRKTNKNLNVCVFGGSGEGKSRFFVKPNILQANCNMIVTDPAGELLEDTGKFLTDHGYVVKVLNLVDMKHSNRYNPFQYIRDDNGVLMMINCLIENTTSRDERGGEKFWKDTEKQMLQAMAFYLIYHQPKYKQNFASILELLRLGEIDENNAKAFSPIDRLYMRDPEEKWDLDDPVALEIKMRDYYAPCGDWAKDAGEYDKNGEFHKYTDIYGRITPVSEARNASIDIGLKFYRDFKKAAGKTAKSIIISCSSRLYPFNLPAVVNLTSSDDIALEELGGLSDDPDRLKQALFGIIPSQDKTFNFLVSMMYSQLFETLFFYAITDPRCKGKRLPRHVTFLLDEFANIGSIPDFNEKLSTIRKHEISCCIILQSLSQIQARYEKDWETIIDNCSTTMFLGGQGKTTTEYISNMLGNQTVTSADRSHSITGRGNASESIRHQSRKLMEPNELREKEYRKVIIIISGLKPFIDNKYDYVKHPNHKYTADESDDNCYTIEQFVESETYEQFDDRVMNEMQAESKSKAPKARIINVEDLVRGTDRWKDYPDIVGMFLVSTVAEAKRAAEAAPKTEEEIRHAQYLQERIERENFRRDLEIEREQDEKRRAERIAERTGRSVESVMAETKPTRTSFRDRGGAQSSTLVSSEDDDDEDE